MNGALEWIGQLAQWFGQFFPRWIILNTTEGAVKFVKGSRVVMLQPGIHWYWPATTEVKAWVVARQAVDLPTQAVVTIDGKSISVGGAVIFRIVEAETLIADTWDPDKLIRVKAAGVVHDVCSRMDWIALQAAKHSGALNMELRRAIRRKLKPYGVRVLDATLTDFAPCRVLKIVQTVSKDEN